MLYFSKPLFEGLIFGGAYIRKGLSTEGNLRFKIDWASFIVGSKFTIFALFYFVFEGNFPSTSPRGAYIWRGDLTDGFLRYQIEGPILILEGLIFGIYGIFLIFCCFKMIKSHLWSKFVKLVHPVRQSGKRSSNEERSFDTHFNEKSQH